MPQPPKPKINPRSPDEYSGVYSLWRTSLVPEGEGHGRIGSRKVLALFMGHWRALDGQRRRVWASGSSLLDDDAEPVPDVQGARARAFEALQAFYQPRGMDRYETVRTGRVNLPLRRMVWNRATRQYDDKANFTAAEIAMAEPATLLDLFVVPADVIPALRTWCEDVAIAHSALTELLPQASTAPALPVIH